MTETDPGGQALLITDDREQAERLSRWISATGLDVVVLAGAETVLMNAGDDDRVRLVVTDLDTAAPPVRALLDRLFAGGLFPDIPQIHVVRDLALLRRALGADPSLAISAIPSPPEPGEFQARVRLAAEVGRLRREASRHSIRDPLTGLFNRRYLLLRLEEEFSRARRHRTPLSLLLADIDRLKEVNDARGQSAGDAILRRVARVVAANTRREDVLGRLGEDLFGVVLSGGRFRGAAVLANKIRTDTAALAVEGDGSAAEIHLSVGISTYPDNGAIASAEDLVRCAENALAEAKNRGGNRVFIDEGVLAKERRVILVADGDADLLDLTEDLLAFDDYRVVKAASAKEALATLRSAAPDLLVLDLGMADEDGPPLIERIEAMFPGSRFPIIGLSRDADADPERLGRLGVDRFVTKPFSLSLLRTAARELLDEAHEA